MSRISMAWVVTPQALVFSSSTVWISFPRRSRSEMSCDEWVSADEVSAMLVERFGKQEFGYGDVYARSSTRPAKNSLNWR